MKLFPAFFNLRQQACLVVGGGEEAAAKVRLLSAADADVVVMAESVSDELQAALDAGNIRRTDAAEAWISGDYRLVIVADATPEVAKTISRDCIARGIPVNVVDRPGLCSFTVPAIVDRNPITVAISTGGASPVMARSIKGQIEALLPAALGALATLYASRRAKVKRLIKSDKRREVYEAAHHGSVAELAYAGDLDAATKALDTLIEHGPCQDSQAGRVIFTDFRHRDVDQVTLGQLRQLQCANTVVFDKHVPHALRELCRRDAMRHSLLAAAPTATVVAKQITNLIEPGQSLVLLGCGSWFNGATQSRLAAQLRAQGLNVDEVDSASAAPARCVTAQ